MSSAFSSREQAAWEYQPLDEMPCDPTPEISLDAVYELKRCADWLNDIGVSKVCLQFPNSLLIDSVAVSQWLMKATGKSVFILGDTSYSSCCIDIVAAQHVPAEAVIHFGSACLSRSSYKGAASGIPILYVFPKCHECNIDGIATSVQKDLHNSKNVLLICSCEFIHIQDAIGKKLCQLPLYLVNSRLMTGEIGRNANPCSVGSCSLDCDVTKNTGSTHLEVCLGRGFCFPPDLSLKDFDVVYVGSEGPFLHSLLASIAVRSHSFSCFSAQGKKFTPALNVTKLARRQLYLSQLVREANTIGLVLASPGDPSLLPAVHHVRALLLSRQSPPRVYSLAVGKPNPAKFANFQEIELFVLLACPQHPLLAPASSQILAKEYYRPIVGLPEVELALNTARVTCGPDFRDLLIGGCDYIPLVKGEEKIGADMSLLTGRMLQISNNCESSGGSLQVVAQDSSSWHVAEQSGAQFLAQRSWQGLDPELGAHPPSVVTMGRSGIASQYSTEPFLE